MSRILCHLFGHRWPLPSRVEYTPGIQCERCGFWWFFGANDPAPGLVAHLWSRRPRQPRRKSRA